MAKDLIEPGDDPVHLFDGMEMGKGFHEALLQEVFGKGGVT
jgi:hypothetical protein